MPTICNKVRILKNSLAKETTYRQKKQIAWKPRNTLEHEDCDFGDFKVRRNDLDRVNFDVTITYVPLHSLKNTHSRTLLSG